VHPSSRNVERGVGVKPDSPEAEAIICNVSRDAAYGYRDGWVDLGVDLRAWVEVERLRLAGKAAA
jgi:hypothetical protein